MWGPFADVAVAFPGLLPNSLGFSLRTGENGGRGSHPHSYSLEGRVKNNHREGLGLDYACVPQARALMK